MQCFAFSKVKKERDMAEKIVINDVDKTHMIKNYYIKPDTKYVVIYKNGEKEEISEEDIEVSPKRKVELADDELLICKEEMVQNPREIVLIGDNIVRVVTRTGKKLNYKSSNVKIEVAKRKIKSGQNNLVFIKEEIKDVETLYYFEKWVKVKFRGGEKFFVYAKEAVEVKINKVGDYKALLDYYREIAKIKDLSMTDKAEDYLKKQLDSLVITDRTALDCFFSRKTHRLKDDDDFTIYPFGINISQREAIYNVYTNQLSLIQGPPGTGKTATILNILANLIMREKNIAVVSSNNEAVKNVLEKMEKQEYGFLIALLGKSKNKKKFFSEQPNYPEKLSSWKKESEEKEELKEEIKGHENKLKELLVKQNELSDAKERLGEYEHEYNFFNEYLESGDLKKLKRFSLFNIDKRKLLELIIELDVMEIDKVNIIKKIGVFLKYGIYDYKQFDDMDAILLKLKDEYYNKVIWDLKKQKEELEKWLDEYDFDGEVEALVEKSKQYFQAYLFDIYGRNSERQIFSDRDYIRSDKFKGFIKEYPIILSTTHAISKSKAQDHVFDYVIFDEASQIELVPGIIALGTAKNAVVVGDLKQLPHIPDNSISDEQYDIWHEKFGISEDYNYQTQNLLSAMDRIFKKNAPSVLLKEHYRCHHRIISFCNKKYYDGGLICHTKNECEKPLVLIRTVEGNHMRYGERAVNKITNVRELDSLIDDEFLAAAEIDFESNKEFGFIAPFRGQANRAEKYFPASFQKDTVHKFQGRECDIILFSTVLDKKRVSKHRMKFVDDASLMNVAVSRAKEKFVLVSSVDVFKEANGEINDLIRYMEYYEEDSVLFQSNIRSIFDLLYSDYKDVLIELRASTNWGKSRLDSENLTENMIRNILEDEENKKYRYANEIKVKEMLRDTKLLTAEELKYVKNNARIDFVIYNKFDNQPMLAIEVDGFAFHENNPKQLVKDKMKKEIMEKYGIKFLSLKTNGSDEEVLVRNYLR